MIPKIIHCCWFGGPKTKLAEKCLASWRRFAPDWEIREWNLSDLSNVSSFCAEAIQHKKWAMVSDWVRMKALYEEGGVYLDFDVELVRPMDELRDGEWVAGEWTAGAGVWMNPGGGIALEKGSLVAGGMLEQYAKLDFDPEREMMPWINDRLKEVIECEGRRGKGEGVRVLPPEIMSPIGIDGKLHLTEKAVGIHWYAMSWASPMRQFTRWLSWHGFRWAIDLALRVRRGLKG